MEHILERTQFLPRPLAEVFSFFADPANLNDLTPASLHFRIETASPIEMRAGTLIDYRLRVHGVPMRWRTRITSYDPPRGFVDEQLRGPYAKWVHTHTFEPRVERGIEGTLMTDRVVYALPRWSPSFVNRVVHRWLVGPDVERIFEFRRAALERRFPAGEMVVK